VICSELIIILKKYKNNTKNIDNILSILDLILPYTEEDLNTVIRIKLKILISVI
jgi:hypothetical protein